MANLRKGVLEKVHAYLSKQKFAYQVLVVDDGSDDGSVEYIATFVKDHPFFTLLKNKHLGKAGAVTAGMLAAKGKYRLFSDMDQATPIEEAEKLLHFFDESLQAGPLRLSEASRQGFDVVIGSRSSRREGSPFIRQFISHSQVVLRKLLVGLPELTDTQCGFKMFKGEVADQLFSRVRIIHKGFKAIHGSNVTSGFDIELLYIADLMGYKIKEVPVQWLYVETRRVNPIKDSIQGVMDLITIKKNAVAGKYLKV